MAASRRGLWNYKSRGEILARVGAVRPGIGRRTRAARFQRFARFQRYLPQYPGRAERSKAVPDKSAVVFARQTGSPDGRHNTAPFFPLLRELDYPKNARSG